MDIRNDLVQAEENLLTKENIQNASALLPLLHGKSDSICRLFKKEIIVDKSALKSLNQMMLEKLSLHPNGAVTTAIDVALSNKRVVSFKSWAEFDQYDFSVENSSTKTVFLQWDFFLQLDQYKVPQRHTVSVRISSSPNPSDFFRALLSGGFDEESDIELQSSTMVCRVDFVNHALAEELINVAEKWNELNEKPISSGKLINKVAYRKRDALANISEILFEFFLAFSLATVMKMLVVNGYLRLSADVVLYTVIALFPYFRLVRFFSRQIGQWLYNAFSKALDMRIFMLTRGDKKEIEKARQDSAIGKEVALFVFNILASIGVSLFFFMME